MKEKRHSLWQRYKEIAAEDSDYNKLERAVALAGPIITPILGWGVSYGIFSGFKAPESVGELIVNVVGSGIANAFFVVPELCAGVVASHLYSKQHKDARMTLAKEHTKEDMIKNSKGKLITDTNLSDLMYETFEYTKDKVFLQHESQPDKIMTVDTKAAKYLDKLYEACRKGDNEAILIKPKNKYLRQLESNGILRTVSDIYLPTEKFYETRVIGVRMNAIPFLKSKYQFIE